MHQTLNITGTFILFSMLVFMPSTSFAKGEIIFTAPPRGPVAKETKMYKPVADYLSRVINKKIIYKFPGNWLTYQNDMQKGKYDIVFDGPHFVAWRIKRDKHEPLVKLPGKLAFAVFSSKKNEKVDKITDLQGRTVCALAPPFLGTLTLYSLFKNPARQPLVLEVKSFPATFKGVTSGKCQAGVLRDILFKRFNKKKKQAKMIYHSKGIPNQAITAGARISKKDKEKITNALLSDKGNQILKGINARFNKKNKPWLPTSIKEYKGLHILLKDVWGFD